MMDEPAWAVEDARTRMLTSVLPVCADETVPLACALGRTLSRPVICPRPLPPFDNAAMDGVAVRLADLALTAARELRVAGTVRAGAGLPPALPAGAALLINTGAPIPAGADAVVPIEQISSGGGCVRVPPGVSPGQHIRRAGENLAAGELVLAAGKRLKPADVGLLAAMGHTHTAVFRPVRVAVMSTGDELVSPGEPLGAGQIHDTNRAMLMSLATQPGLEVKDAGWAPDCPVRLSQKLLAAAQDADIMITSGGVSMGEADHVTTVLAQSGEILLKNVKMKPGRPLVFGHLGRAAFFGLPGNPVAAMITFLEFVQPVLERLMGSPTPQPAPLVLARSAHALDKKPGRTEYRRARLFWQHNAPWAHDLGEQGSGILRSVSQADCLLIVPEHAGPVGPGEPVIARLL